VSKKRQSSSKTTAPAVARAESHGNAAVVPFAETLRRRQKEAGTRRKGERTRDRLKVAAVQVMEERGYLALRVADVCKRAKVSPAVFYLYFKNKQDITVQVLTEFVHDTFRQGATGTATRPLFESIYEANLRWITLVRANSGLMRCLLQLSDEVPEFKQLSEKTNHEWFVYVTQRLLSRFPKARVDQETLLLAVYALGGMMDELSRKVLVSREEHLQPLVESITPTDGALAEFLSVLWYRALFGTEPAAVRHATSQGLLNLSAIKPGLGESA